MGSRARGRTSPAVRLDRLGGRFGDPHGDRPAVAVSLSPTTKCVVHIWSSRSTRSSPPGRRARLARLDVAGVRPRHALLDRADTPLVSDDAPVPAARSSTTGPASSARRVASWRPARAGPSLGLWGRRDGPSPGVWPPQCWYVLGVEEIWVRRSGSALPQVERAGRHLVRSAAPLAGGHALRRRSRSRYAATTERRHESALTAAGDRALRTPGLARRSSTCRTSRSYRLTLAHHRPDRRRRSLGSRVLRSHSMSCSRSTCTALDVRP